MLLHSISLQLCDDLNVQIEGMYTHFADFENKDFTQLQLETFLTAIQPYR